MENFSLLTISGPRFPSFALKSIPDLTCPIHTASLPDCLLTEMQSNEPLRRNCTIYRPWYSPYSYFVCMDKDSQVNSCSLPDTLRGNGREGPSDARQAEEIPDSISSSSGSLEKGYPQYSSSSGRKTRIASEAKDCITSQDILLASKWQPLQQNGYKCMACCRMFPTLHSLKTHIKCGSKEGFSCKVYYHKIKALCEKEHKCRSSSRPAGSGSSSSSKMLK
ncbi:spermatogenesis-associated protein 46 [Hemicordylus capensis]|uniref:spermatogenesis-associated protein 46 n=1 Tax=Hemicordylus capensis TaxID=884348 RepID=UPI0023030D61|nr:spermatogenesis-associated protein 46 [Hemicordylus capensis]